jgi:hypothetical protein
MTLELNYYITNCYQNNNLNTCSNTYGMGMCLEEGRRDLQERSWVQGSMHKDTLCIKVLYVVASALYTTVGNGSKCVYWQSGCFGSIRLRLSLAYF